jgi:hypothetical protein
VSNVIGQGRGRPYCANPSKKLCKPEANCNICRKKTIDSEYNRNDIMERDLEYDATRNEKPANQVFSGSDTEKHWWICRKKSCGRHFEANALSVMRRGTGCPYCLNKSENAILSFLENALETLGGWTWKRQDKLQNQSNPRHRFDLIARHVKGVVVTIEVDGEQHFWEVGFNGSKPRNHKIQRRDDIEKTRCSLDGGFSNVRIACIGGLPRGERLKKLGEAFLSAVVATASRSYPTLECIDADRLGIYDSFLGDLFC